MHDLKYILSGTYFCPNSIKIENQALATTKLTKEEPLNLNLAGLSEVKSLSSTVSLS